MFKKSVRNIAFELLVLLYIISAIFTFLIVKRSPYMYSRFYVTFPAKTVLFLALGIAGYVLTAKYGKKIFLKYGWIIGVLDCILLICERYFISNGIIRSCILLVEPIAIIGTAGFTYGNLSKKSYINWLTALLPILMFCFTDNVTGLILTAVYALMIFFSFKAKLSDKGILILYSLLVFAGIAMLLKLLVVSCADIGYQIHNRGHMANVISEGLPSAKLFGKAAVLADGERKTYIIYHIIMNFGYFAAAVVLILTGMLEAIAFKSAYSAQDDIQKFTAYSVFVLLLVKSIVSLLTNFGIVLNGFFTFFPIVSFALFEAISIFTMAGILSIKE